MTAAEKLTTTLSTKGQLILPQAIRRRRQWGPGTKLIVEETPEGVLLKAAPLFPPTRPQDVFGSARHQGPPLSIGEMDAAIEKEARQRRDRGRY